MYAGAREPYRRRRPLCPPVGEGERETVLYREVGGLPVLGLVSPSPGPGPGSPL